MRDKGEMLQGSDAYLRIKSMIRPERTYLYAAYLVQKLDATVANVLRRLLQIRPSPPAILRHKEAIANSQS